MSESNITCPLTSELCDQFCAWAIWDKNIGVYYCAISSIAAYGHIEAGVNVTKLDERG